MRPNVLLNDYNKIDKVIERVEERVQLALDIFKIKIRHGKVNCLCSVPNRKNR